MKRHTYVAVLATLMSASAWGQEVSLYGTTMAQMWKSETPGFNKATYTPATQFLGIDATKLGTDNLSLHLFGWGKTDLSESSNFDGTKSAGYLNYGYLQYQFSKANAEIKAGRFTVNQSTGFEQVDGISARTDLRNGFTLSAFAGKPVIYKAGDLNHLSGSLAQSNYAFQRDVIFGTRLGWRPSSTGEIGISYLQDGSKMAKDLTIPQPVDYTRRQLGIDLTYVPTTFLDFRGRTIYDVANQRSNIAENDYTATIKLGSQVSVAGNYAERNFLYYFAGTNLPSLFRQTENDKFQGWGGSVTWNAPGSIQVVADYRHTNRETYGEVNRAGGELRWANADRTLMMGASGHVANATKTLLVDATAPFRSLSYEEARAWVMVTKGKFTASLDGILQKYQASNPYLNGLKNLSEVVGSLGYEITKNVKVSGDLSRATTAVSKNETRGLLRAEYRFGMASKGGR